MPRSRSRWSWRVVAVLIVLIEATVAQRARAQRRAEVLPGLRFGPPLRAGLAIGAAYGDRLGRLPFAGPIALGEVAVAGARASVGYFFAGPFASGIELLGSAMRTWGSPAQLDRNRTLFGGEARASFFLVNLGVGVFRPTPVVSGDKRSRIYLNVGLGI